MVVIYKIKSPWKINIRLVDIYITMHEYHASGSLTSTFDQDHFTTEQELRWEKFYKTHKTLQESEDIVNEHCPEPHDVN